MTTCSCHHSGTKAEYHEGAEEEEITVDVDGQRTLPKETGLQWGFEVYIGFRIE